MGGGQGCSSSKSEVAHDAHGRGGRLECVLGICAWQVKHKSTDGETSLLYRVVGDLVGADTLSKRQKSCVDVSSDSEEPDRHSVPSKTKRGLQSSCSASGSNKSRSSTGFGPDIKASYETAMAETDDAIKQAEELMQTCHTKIDEVQTCDLRYMVKCLAARSSKNNMRDRPAINT